MNREITVFKVEFGGIKWAEWRVRPNIGTAAKAALLGLGAIGVAMYGRQAVDMIDSTLRPQYVVNGQHNALLPDADPTPWVRPTDWNRKVK